jgi:hypothetical protein
VSGVVAALATTGLIGISVAAHAAMAPPTPTLDGTLVMAHGDTFNGSPMGMAAELRTKSGVVHLNIPYTRHNQFAALAGKHVRISGSGTPSAFSATSVTAVGATASLTPRQMRVAVFMLHSNGSTSEPISKTSMQNTFFGASNSVADWFAQTSNNQVQMTGTVYGYYDNTYNPGSCPDSGLGSLINSLTSEGASKAAADGYNAANFDYQVVYVPNLPNCGFAGVAWIGMSGVVLNGTDAISVDSHELGHNLGLSHAGSFTCGPNKLTGPSQNSCVSDYGDPHDVMGSSQNEYNAAHKYRLGWIPASQVRTVSSGTQTIALSASETDVNPGATTIIQVPRPGGGAFSIERRASIGTYDSGMSGVWVRTLDAFNTDDTELVPMAAYGGFSDGRLAPGETWNDTADGISLKTISDATGSSTASVEVCVGPCGSGGTTTTSSPSSTSSTTAASTSTTTSSSTTTTTIPGGNTNVSVHVNRGTIVITGTSGDDVVHVTKVHDNLKQIDANGAPITIGQGCSLSTTATIPTALCHGSGINASLGAGNDTLVMVGSWSSRSTLDGGPGNDTFVAGYGPETFIGGDGFDTVDFSGRAVGTVNGAIGIGNHSGARRDHDNIETDIERVILPT